MTRIAVVMLCVVILLQGTAFAEEKTLGWDDGKVDVFNFLDQEAHFVKFSNVPGWDKTFSQAVTFYAKHYGDIGKLRANIVFWGPQTEKTRRMEDLPDNLVVYWTKQFRIADYISETASWVTIPVDPIELPNEYWVSIYTFSNEERGVLIGLDSPSDFSHSSQTRPATQNSEFGKLVFREDGRDWMIRVKVQPTSTIHDEVKSSELTGPGFGYFDDGTADGYANIQKYGALVSFNNSKARKLSKVWIYGYVDGDWFDTKKEAGVYLMNERFQIISRGQLTYNQYTGDPSWEFVSFPSVRVPENFYILVAPFCRPEASLMIGYDSSGGNQASGYATVGGSDVPWDLDFPEETTNWMVRAEYD